MSVILGQHQNVTPCFSLRFLFVFRCILWIDETLLYSHMTVSRWLKGSRPQKPSIKVNKYTVVIDIIKTSIVDDPFISIIKLQDITKNDLAGYIE